MAAAFQKVLEVVIRGDEADATRALGQMQRQIESLGRRADRVGRQLTRGLTLPIAGAVAVALRAGTQFDNAFAAIERRTGAQGAQLQALRQDFREVFRGVPEDARTVAEAIGDINTRLGLTGEPLQRTTRQILDFARLTEADLTATVAGVTRVFGDWNVSTERQGQTLDMLFRATQRTGVGTEALTRQLVQFGAPLRQMGFDIEGATALLGRFEREGVNTELVLGSLRIALGQLARSGVEDPAEAFSVLTREIRDAGSAGEATRRAIELFGARAGPDMAAAIREGRLEIADLVGELRRGEGSIESAAESSRTLGERFRILRNRAMEAGEPMGTRLVAALERAFPHMERLVDVGGRLIDRFLNLPPPVLAAAAAFTALAAASGPAFLLASTGIRTFASILTIIGALAGPAGIAALVGAFSTLGAALAPGAAVAAGLGLVVLMFRRIQQGARETRQAIAGETDRLAAAVDRFSGEALMRTRARLEQELEDANARVRRAGEQQERIFQHFGESRQTALARSSLQNARFVAEQIRQQLDAVEQEISRRQALPELRVSAAAPTVTGPSEDAIEAAKKRAEAIRDVMQRLARDIGAAERQAAVLGGRFNLDAALAQAYEAAIRDLSRAGVELGEDIAGTGLTLRDLAADYDTARRADEAFRDQVRREDAIRNRIRAFEDQNRALRLSVVELSAHELAVLGASEAQQRYARFLADANEELEWQRRIQEEAAEAVERAADRSGAAADELRARYDMVARTAERMAQRTVDAWTDMTEGLFGRVRRMVDAILEELARLWAAQHILDPLTRLFGGFLGADTPAAPAAVAAPAGPVSTGGHLFGFQHGGSFTVGGTGPADSKLVAFMATPGEQVDVRTPGQAAAGSGNTFNITTPITIVTPDVVTMRQWVSRNREMFAEEVLAGLQASGF